MTAKPDIVERLQTRAAIRRQVPSRKSVQEGKPDRMADLLDEAADEITALRKRLDDAERERDEAYERAAKVAGLRRWLDSNTTHMTVRPECSTDAPNVPVLASVSKRIWYHATDDETSWPFSAVADNAMSAQGDA